MAEDTDARGIFDTTASHEAGVDDSEYWIRKGEDPYVIGKILLPDEEGKWATYRPISFDGTRLVSGITQTSGVEGNNFEEVTPVMADIIDAEGTAKSSADVLAFIRMPEVKTIGVSYKFDAHAYSTASVERRDPQYTYNFFLSDKDAGDLQEAVVQDSDLIRRIFSKSPIGSRLLAGEGIQGSGIVRKPTSQLLVVTIPPNMNKFYGLAATIEARKQGINRRRMRDVLVDDIRDALSTQQSSTRFWEAVYQHEQQRFGRDTTFPQPEDFTKFPEAISSVIPLTYSQP